MRIVCSVLLICSVKVVISAKLIWSKYALMKNTRIPNPLSSVTTITSPVVCCTMCHMSGTCDFAAYNSESRVCELGKMELGEKSSSTGWDLYTESKCPTGWKYFDNSCLMLETETLSWTVAQENCVNKINGGHLAYAKTEEKNEYLSSLITDGLVEILIGGSRLGSEMFCWGDGTPLNGGFTNWNDGEPSHAKGVEDCMSMKKSETTSEFGWNDLPCSAPIESVCEKELD